MQAHALYILKLMDGSGATDVNNALQCARVFNDEGN